MSDHRLLKVQTPAVTWRLGGRWARFGAHNFIVHMDPDGHTLRELHGIARGPEGSQLPFMGGLVPFRREFIRGETFTHRTGFYGERHPQGVLFEGARGAVEALLGAAAAVQAEVNARNIRYPWPATTGANSNAYYSTLLAGMGLEDVRAQGELWAPSSGRLLLPKTWLTELATSSVCPGQTAGHDAGVPASGSC
jgi:hypothetical protein